MIYINSDKCTGCGECADNCPFQAISIIDNLAVIDGEKCRQCGLCIHACPNNAIGEKTAVYSLAGKGGDPVMRGRGWFGMGYGGWFGRRFGRWFGRGFGMGRGMARGNPFPFCRFYPWLPRRRWGRGMGYYPPATPAYYHGHTPYRW